MYWLTCFPILWVVLLFCWWFPYNWLLEGELLCQRLQPLWKMLKHNIKLLSRNVEISFFQHKNLFCPTLPKHRKLLCYKPLLISNKRRCSLVVFNFHFLWLLKSEYLFICLLVVCVSSPVNYQFMSLAHLSTQVLGIFNWLVGKFSFSNLLFGFQRQLRTYIFDSFCITYEILFGKSCLVRWLWFLGSLFSVRHREVIESW